MRHLKNRLSIATRLAPGAIALLAGAAAALAGPPATTAPAPAAYPLTGVARDFSPSHTDFLPAALTGAGYSAGNISAALSPRGVPVYTGAGALIVNDARDAQGRPIAPALVTAAPVTSFTITGASVSSTKPMAAKVTVIGAAISAGGAYDCAVTMQVHAGAALVTPFGSYAGAITGNVNDGANPRASVMPSMILPGTAISIDARSWTRKNASSPSTKDTDWQQLMSVNSASGGANVRALRNGDASPTVAGYLNQTSAKTFLAPYLDPVTNKIKLAANQVIYLFELGSTDTRSAAFDMQDLVVLVDLATDPSYFTNDGSAPAPAPCVTLADTAAVRGATSTGGVASAANFDMWFEDRPGYNVSAMRTINLVRGTDGVYTYSTPDFHPIDGDLYGNGANPHNRGFTFAVDATFSYCGCTGQFFEYTGDGDAWLFVNGKLVMDLGGVHVGARQFVDMDRLGLTDGQKVKFQLFTAERSTTNAAFSIKTNIVLDASPALRNHPVSGLHD